MRVYLANKGAAKNVLHGSGEVLVIAYKLQRQLSFALAQLVGSTRHTSACHMRINLEQKPILSRPRQADGSTPLLQTCTDVVQDMRGSVLIQES